MKKATVIVLILILILISQSNFLSTQASSAPLSLNVMASTVAESRDYATEVLGDPWDMSNAEDMTQHIKRFAGVSMSGGTWNATTTSNDSQFWFLWAGYPGAYATSRNGSAKPVNASLYKRLSFRMYVGLTSTQYRRGQFYWFTRADLKGAKVELFRVYPGWHTYQIDLPSSWSGWPVSLRMDPIDRANTPIKIDWIRLTNRPSTSVNLEWSDSSRGDATVYLDNDASGLDGSSLEAIDSTAGANSESIDLDGVEPGSYYLYLKKADGSYSNYSAEPTTINKAPFVKITEPDEMGGKDWATSVLKNPWDMKSRRDLSKTYNIGGSSYRGGVYTGINSTSGANGARKNDPYIMFNLGGKAINTNKYHRVTFKYKYSGGFSLARGTMSRFGWTLKHHNDPRFWQMTDDIVTYAGWNTITIDLDKIKLNRGSYGWSSWATKFRFDAHEDNLSRRFYVDSVYLREDDKLTSSFAIKYNLIDINNSTVGVKIYRDKDRIFGNGNEAEITQMDVSPGANTYRWAPPGSLKGLYWIYIQGSDGVNTSGYYSGGPLRVH